MNWLLAVSAVVLLGLAVVTLRAAEQSTQHAPSPAATPTALGATSHAVAPGGSTKQHPPASAPEESATIADDPTTAPDPNQSADNNVSFPTDI